MIQDFYFLVRDDGSFYSSKQGTFLYHSLEQAMRFGANKYNWSTRSVKLLHLQWDGEKYNVIEIIEPKKDS